MTAFRYLFGRFPLEVEELEELARELGVSISGDVTIYEAQRRIREAVRHRMNSWLWLIALALCYSIGI